MNKKIIFFFKLIFLFFFTLDDYFKPALDLIDSIVNEKIQLLNQFDKFNENYRLALNEKPKLSIETFDINSDSVSDESKVKLKHCQVSYV